MNEDVKLAKAAPDIDPQIAALANMDPEEAARQSALEVERVRNNIMGTAAKVAARDRLHGWQCGKECAWCVLSGGALGEIKPCCIRRGHLCWPKSWSQYAYKMAEWQKEALIHAREGPSWEELNICICEDHVHQEVAVWKFAHQHGFSVERAAQEPMSKWESGQLYIAGWSEMDCPKPLSESTEPSSSPGELSAITSEPLGGAGPRALLLGLLMVWKAKVTARALLLMAPHNQVHHRGGQETARVLPTAKKMGAETKVVTLLKTGMAIADQGG